MANNKKILTTGEFAKLCKTTKETLFHYDREGLLKPRHVSENGYRHYGVEQFFDFDMIAMLKETGSSLKEIKAYLRNTDAGDFLALLEDKRRILQRERARLARRATMLDDLAACTREALQYEYDAFSLQRQEEERLEVFPTAMALSDSTQEFVERLAEYIDFYQKGKRAPRFPFGVLLSQEDVAQGHYQERYFFSRATRSTPKARLHVKPAGDYALLAHKGTVQTHRQAFGGLLRHIRDAGLAVAGNAYVYDMMTYVLLGTGESYAVKYCVRVRPKTATP